MGRKVISRRNFISGSVLGATSVCVSGLASNPGLIPKSLVPDNVQADKIIYRSLGKTGIIMPVVSMGVMNTNNTALIKKAFEMGVRHFDTAAIYGLGRNEQKLGEVIKELDVRDEVVITTKIPHIAQSLINQMSADEIEAYFLKIFNESLSRLQTKYIDIILLHDVQTSEYLHTKGFRTAMEKLKKKGKTRCVGFSTHSNMTECIKTATKEGFYEVVLTAFNYAMHQDERYIEVLNKASQAGIGLVAMKTMCSQPWYREHGEQQLYEGNINYSALLKWVLQHDFISTSIPGMKTYQELDENFRIAYNLEYTEEEKLFLTNRNVILGMQSVCKQCKSCINTCPKRAYIPDLIRAHMYAANYTDFDLSKQTLKNIEQSKGLLNCLSCEDCVAHCKNKVDIKKRIDDLKTLYS